MSWTKRQLLSQAFDFIGLASYVYDLQPEQWLSALNKMNAMVLSWNANGLRTGYNGAAAYDGSDLDLDSGLSDICYEGVYMNVGLRLAPSYSMDPTPFQMKLASDALETLNNWCMDPVIERQFPNTMPRGAGAKPWRNLTTPFLNYPTKYLADGQDSYLGDIALDGVDLEDNNGANNPNG